MDKLKTKSLLPTSVLEVKLQTSAGTLHRSTNANSSVSQLLRLCCFMFQTLKYKLSFFPAIDWRPLQGVPHLSYMTVSSFPESLNGYITAHAVCYSYIKKRENIVKEEIYVHFLLDKQRVLLLNNERCHINKSFFTVTVTVCCFFLLAEAVLDPLKQRNLCFSLEVLFWVQ